MDASPPPAAALAPTRWRRVLLGAERLAVAHVASYPLALLWAVAAIPLTIHLFIHDLDALGGGDPDRLGRFVVARLAWPAGAAFVLAHALAVPWACALEVKRWQRLSLLGLALEAALGLVCGGASWAWLMLR